MYQKKYGLYRKLPIYGHFFMSSIHFCSDIRSLNDGPKNVLSKQKYIDYI